MMVGLWPLLTGPGLGQSLTFGSLEPVYDGGPRYPELRVAGLPRPAQFSGREILPAAASVVFSNKIPEILPLSYNSLGFSATATSALGNPVQLAGTARVADFVEVVMVTWATAAQYPALAALDPGGYRHPVSAAVYQLKTTAGVTSLLPLDEGTVQVQIPWRPASQADGTPYPFNGFAFKALIPLSASVTVPGSCVIAISFNTQNAGAAPLGVSGPYNQLNLALSSVAPTIGVDPDPNSVFWIHNGIWYYPASNWGGYGAPMLRLSARATALPQPALAAAFQPLHAGTYHLRAKVVPENLEADAVLTIGKAPVLLETAGLTKSIADPDPFLRVINAIPGLATTISYGGSATPPGRPGVYPFSITVTDRDHSGSLAGNFHLTGMSFQQWSDQRFADAGAGAGSADPDGDGQANWLEYAVGGDPQQAAPALTLEKAAGGMKASFQERREMPGVRIALEFSQDLRTWQAAPTVRENRDDLWDSMRAQSTTPRGFFRLTAVADPPEAR